MPEGFNRFAQSEKGALFFMNEREQDEKRKMALSGEKTAKIVEEVFVLANRRLQEIMQQPPAVAVFSRVAAAAEFSIPLRAENEWRELRDNLKTINKILEKQGIKFSNIGRPVPDINGEELIMTVALENLWGFERESLLGGLPGGPRFRQEQGFAGLADWKTSRAETLKRLQQEGKISNGTDLKILASELDAGGRVRQAFESGIGLEIDMQTAKQELNQIYNDYKNYPLFADKAARK